MHTLRPFITDNTSRSARLVLGALLLAGCVPFTPGSTPGPTVQLTSTQTASTATAPEQSQTPTARTGGSAVVVFVKDGSLWVWEEATGQSKMIYDSGDVFDLSLSDDGKVVAFLRRSAVERDEDNWYEQSGLWAMEREGGSPHELVSAEELRELLGASEADSTNIPQMAWIPGTHRLLFSGWTYLVQGEGESHAVPAGLFLVDADTGANMQFLPPSDSARFSPSPDGRRVAIISLTGLTYMELDGLHSSQQAVSWPRVGLEVAFPSGVWARDSTSFLITGPIEAAEPGASLSTWRVPVDGAPPQRLVDYSDSHSDSVTFSPDGRYMAFYKSGPPLDSQADYGWFVALLTDEMSPLAAPSSAYLFWQNLHWSPVGIAYAIHEGNLVRLCPGAMQDSEVCAEGLNLGDRIAQVKWIDGSRFVWVTREPYDLYFGRLDGTRTLIAEGAERFATLAQTCRNGAELLPGADRPDAVQAPPDSLFQTTWRFQNTGTCDWDDSYRLGFFGGDRLSGPHSLPLGEFVPPGGEIELPMQLIAPGTAGTYQGLWRLFGPDGSPFGSAAGVEIMVPFGHPVDLTTGQILARIATGARPQRVALGEGAAWVTNEAAGTVSRIDMDTKQVVAAIPVGRSPRSVAVGLGAVWVTDSYAPSVSRVDPSTNRVSATIALDLGEFAAPREIGVGAGSVWVTIGVTGGDTGNVVRIDPETNEVIAVIEVERWPAQVAASDDAVWVTHSVTPILSRIDPDTNEVSATVGLGCRTGGLAAEGATVWAVCVNAPFLYRIDAVEGRVLARIAIGERSDAIALAPNGAWVTSSWEQTLTRVDPEANRAAQIYRVGGGPLGVAAWAREVWVALSAEGGVLVLLP